ncbi:hypothetical protein PILCRDRAFT_821709 [Piloderma croceum F 1598]|uniref:Peptidase M14 domain-containing protein n=1 Tax=Piloderma croceum (strain F 1598) TaxID=765440 RepID=A0A0C3FNE4_PILCF|nr:hypothetical protein PILCRDRAFT_821709 [Piloderma croceum F 1598]
MGFVITGAQHAREWIATATGLYLTHALVAHPNPHPIPNTNATDDLNHIPTNLHTLLDKFDFYVIPVPNPDGYDYTWESDRFWYKNRMKTGAGSKCVGVDMNRHCGYKWRPTVSLTASLNASNPNQTQKSHRQSPNPPGDHPCSHWYPGSRPFQAPEVNHIASFVETLPNLKAFVDLRSYGQMLSSPFSFTCSRLPNDAENQLEAALGAVSALRKPYGTMFNTGSLCSMFYRAHGNIVDWMYKSAGIKYSYAAHLRDTGTYGFALPPHLIRPVGEETAHMIEYLANFIAHIEK